MNKHRSWGPLVSVGLLLTTGTALAGNPLITSTGPLPNPGVICATCDDPGGGGSPNPGAQSFHFDYFHADHPSETYAIRLHNGLHATFNFQTGTVELSNGTQTEQFSLHSVLMKAADGDSENAATMHTILQQAIGTEGSATIVIPQGESSLDNGIHPRQHLGSGLFPLIPGSGPGDPLWSAPNSGECWPLQFPCYEQTAATDAGNAKVWWRTNQTEPYALCDSSNGTIGGQAPGVPTLIMACHNLGRDLLIASSAKLAAAGVCAGAVAQLGADPFADMACAGGVGLYAAAEMQWESDTRVC